MKQDEDILQKQCESYLKLFSAIKYIHIPKQIQRYIWASKAVPAHVAMITSKALKGVPDLIIFNNSKHLIVELKSGKGTLTKEQEDWLSHGMHVVRSFEQFKDLVERELL
jgi:hypothetical protein